MHKETKNKEEELKIFFPGLGSLSPSPGGGLGGPAKAPECVGPSVSTTSAMAVSRATGEGGRQVTRQTSAEPLLCATCCGFPTEAGCGRPAQSLSNGDYDRAAEADVTPLQNVQGHQQTWERD